MTVVTVNLKAVETKQDPMGPSRSQSSLCPLLLFCRKSFGFLVLLSFKDQAQ